MSFRTLTARIALAVLVAFVALPLGAEVIDDFETAQAMLTDTGSSVVTDNGADVVLGDHRELEIELIEGTAGATVEASGSLIFDATAGGDTRAVASVVWDADTNTTVFDGDGLGGVDLTDNNESAFRIEVQSASVDTQILLEVFTNDGNSSKAGLRLPAVVVPASFFLSYADFIPNLGIGADFTTVGAIVLRVLGTNVAVDISHFETVGPSLTVTKIDIDPNDDMDFGTDPVVPGDTIRYQIQITNDGGLAQQVDMVDTVDSNTSFTADSLTATPVALVDTVAVLGNVTRTVADPGVLGNDEDPDGDAFFVRITGSDAMSAEGGTIAWNDAGSDDQGEGGFQYFPPAGFRGVDSFNYELEDADGQTAVGLVTVLLDRVIWFVDDNHPGANLGTLADPFTDFTQLDDSPGDVDRDGDIIFVYAHSVGNYSHAGLELEPGQGLIGEGEGLTVDGNVIVPASATALIHANDPGAGVAHGTKLTMNNTIRGVTFGDTEGYAISGSNFGTLTVSNTTVTGAGGILDVNNGTLDVVLASSSSSGGSGTAIDLDFVNGSLDAGSTTITGGVGGIRVANGGNGTFDFGAAAVSGVTTGLDLGSSTMAMFSFDSLDVTSSGTALLIHSAGTVEIGGVANTLETTTAGAAISAQLTSMGSGGWTFDNVTSDNSPNEGIFLNAMMGGNFLVSGSTDINEPRTDGIVINLGGARTYDFGSTSISGTGSLVPLTNGHGVRIIFGNTMSSLVFDSLNVTTDNGHGVIADDVGLVAIAGTTNSIIANNGNALWLESTTVDEVPGGPLTGITFATLSSANSPLDGINLQFVTGSVTGNAGSITGAMDAAVRIGSAANNSGGSSNVTYAGSITNTQDFSVLVQERNGGAVALSGTINDTGTGIRVQNNNNGVANTVTFSGSPKILNTGASTAVLLDNNDDAVVSFTGGGLDIDTSGAVTAFNAINGGTVQVTGAGNSVNTTVGTGVAVNIAATTIGPTGVTFERVDASGAPNGIVLNTTGSAGAFMVSGDGSMTGGVLDRDGSGGTITSTTNDGVSLTAAHNVTLRQMNVTNCGNSTAGDDCIDSSGGSNHVLSAVHVTNATGTGVNEEFGNGWRLTNITGSNRIDHGSLFTSFPTASTHAVRLRNTNTNGNLTISRASFTNQGAGNSGTFVTAQAFGSSVVNFTTEGTRPGGVGTPSTTLFSGLRGDAILSALEAGATGSMTTIIRNSDFRDAAGNGSGSIAATVNQAGATHNVTIEDNIFNNLSTTLAAPVGVVTTNIAANGGNLNVTIQRNDLDIVQGTRRGIQVVAQPGAGSGALNLTVDNNTIDRIPGNFGILVDVDDLIGNSTLTVTNNQIGQAAGFLGNVGEVFDGAFLVRTRGTPAATNTLTISNNNIRATTSGGGRIMYIDARDDRTSNLNVLNNTIRNDDAGAADPEFFLRAQVGSPTVCLNLNGNNAIDNTGANGSGSYEIRQVNGTVNVEDLANVNANNQGTVSTVGTVGTAVDCIP